MIKLLSEDSSIDIQSHLEYLFFEVSIVTIDLVDHSLLVCECFNRLNTFIDNLVAFFDLLEQQNRFFTLIAS